MVLPTMNTKKVKVISIQNSIFFSFSLTISPYPLVGRLYIHVMQAAMQGQEAYLHKPFSLNRPHEMQGDVL